MNEPSVTREKVADKMEKKIEEKAATSAGVDVDVDMFDFLDPDDNDQPNKELRP